MNSKDRRREYRRLVRKRGVKYYILKIDDELVGIFKHHAIWKPRVMRIGIPPFKSRTHYRIAEVSEAEYGTYTAFDFPAIERSSLFGPIRVFAPR